MNIVNLIDFIFWGLTIWINVRDFFIIHKFFKLKVFRDNLIFVECDHRESFLKNNCILILAYFLCWHYITVLKRKLYFLNVIFEFFSINILHGINLLFLPLLISQEHLGIIVGIEDNSPFPITLKIHNLATLIFGHDWLHLIRINFTQAAFPSAGPLHKRQLITQQDNIINDKINPKSIDFFKLVKVPDSDCIVISGTVQDVFVVFWRYEKWVTLFLVASKLL